MMKRIGHLLILLVLLSAAGCIDRWRTPETTRVLNSICAKLCGKLGGSYAIGASGNAFGCVFNYQCVCQLASKGGEPTSESFVVEVPVGKVERLVRAENRWECSNHFPHHVTDRDGIKSMTEEHGCKRWQRRPLPVEKGP